MAWRQESSFSLASCELPRETVVVVIPVVVLVFAFIIPTPRPLINRGFFVLLSVESVFPSSANTVDELRATQHHLPRCFLPSQEAVLSLAAAQRTASEGEVVSVRDARVR